MWQKSARELQEALSAPFQSADIEWRVSATNTAKTSGLAVPYVTNRAIQNRLDSTVGIDGWHNDFVPWKGEKAQLCGISIYLPELKDWLTKWDGADDSDIESVKGGLTERVSEEVCAAICALLRRPSLSEYSLGSAPPVQIVHKGIMMDPLRQKVTIDGVEVVLTALEFKLLYLLASNPSIVFSKERIYERLWSENSIYGCQSVVDMVCSIRKKLKISSKDSTYIKTIKGAGYCFAP